jgi:hypothetical protein
MGGDTVTEAPNDDLGALRGRRLSSREKQGFVVCVDGLLLVRESLNRWNHVRHVGLQVSRSILRRLAGPSNGLRVYPSLDPRVGRYVSWGALAILARVGSTRRLRARMSFHSMSRMLCGRWWAAGSSARDPPGGCLDFQPGGRRLTPVQSRCKSVGKPYRSILEKHEAMSHMLMQACRACQWMAWDVVG